MPGMKLISIISLAVVASQAAQEAVVSPILQCFETRKCGDDVNCRAACVGAPAPSQEAIQKTNECYSKCTKDSSAEEIVACRARCDNIYMNNPNDSNLPNDSGSPSGSNGSNNSSKPNNSTNPKSNSTSTSSSSTKPHTFLLPAASLLASGILAML